MDPLKFSIEQIVSQAQLTQDDLSQVGQCRRQHNQLGFGYQLAFVKVLNRFPVQLPFEIIDEILYYVSVQIGIPGEYIDSYTNRRETISEHQERIRRYLKLSKFGENIFPKLKKFIFKEACRLEQTGALKAKTEQFLREQRIIRPSSDTLQRIIANQKKAARNYIFSKIINSLSPDLMDKLDSILDTTGKRFSDFHKLKQPPSRPSPTAMLRLIEKIEMIKESGILEIDLSWLSNNYQRFLSKYAKRCDAYKMRELEPKNRYSALVCFYAQNYKDTIDFMVDMFDKLINRIYNHAQNDIDENNKSGRKQIRHSLVMFRMMAELVLDETIDDNALRLELFNYINKDELSNQVANVDTWLNGKYSNVFNLVKERFSYIRQFSPSLLKHLQLQSESVTGSSLIKAIDMLRSMNEINKRKIPDNAPLDFVPKKTLPIVLVDGKIDKPAWECALLTAIRDEIKSGNYSVKGSKQFGRFEDYFIPQSEWEVIRDSFFNRNGLPANPRDVAQYFKNRINTAYEQFLKTLPENTFARIDEGGWSLSSVPGEKLDKESEIKLEALKRWLSNNMRSIKLPDLLIEVDNTLKISKFFMSPTQRDDPTEDDICAILAAVIAHGCNIGTYTMAQIIDGISYSRLKHISDWMLTEDAQRTALATVANAIAQLDITKEWGQGRTSSSDGQRFSLRRKVLQQTYSPKFNDFAIEFYSFIADNYAPFYSMPIECTDRDAPFVLDGILYNESDLPIEEHYVDTHGYTENNFAAFAMIGKRFAPRIRGLNKQRIYRIDDNKDYGVLTPLVGRKDRTINMNWITEQWDRIGHFYASLECGHTTASTAMKRLNGFTGKNHFYRGNRELGRAIKTEHILQYMSDKSLRLRTRRGLLKVEQLHSLARDLKFGKRGRISQRDLQEQKNSCSCLTLIMASIVYWQANEIYRVVRECCPKENDIDLALLEHISPISWDNVILYGEYVLNRSLIEI